MKIVVSSLYFHPDHSGISLYATDFAKYASEEGHEVHVMTGFPFYPNWKKRKEDRRKLLRTDFLDGIKIHRGYTYVPNRPSTLKRLIQEFFIVFFSFVNYLKVGRPDAIVVFTTPVTLGLLGVFMKWIFGSKLIINVQDFQVEAASSLKMVKGSFFVNLLARIERFSYKHADYVSSISHSMLDILREKNVPNDQILFWPNWIDVDDYSTSTVESGQFRKKHGIGQKDIIVGYAGNVGLKQGLESMVDLANEFLNRTDLKFFIIGEGAGLESLKEYYNISKPENITFLPFLGPEDYKEFLKDTEIIFISQKKTEKDIYFPSKLLGIMAMGKMILLTADKDSELYRVLKENELGIVTDYGDLNALKNGLEGLLVDPGSKARFGDRSRSFVNQYDRKTVLRKIIQEI